MTIYTRQGSPTTRAASMQLILSWQVCKETLPNRVSSSLAREPGLDSHLNWSCLNLLNLHLCLHGCSMCSFGLLVDGVCVQRSVLATPVYRACRTHAAHFAIQLREVHCRLPWAPAELFKTETTRVGSCWFRFLSTGRS